MSALIPVLALALGLASAPLGAQPGVPSDSGDFRVGDRIVLAVVGEPQLSDTFTVVSGPALMLPNIGAVSLAGVRRAALEPYLTGVIDRYVRNASVRATSTVRLGIVGEVLRPGFYSIPSEGSVTDALMAAGGPTQNAKLDAIEVTRRDQSSISADSVQAGIVRNLTLADMGVHSGDQLVVPRNGDFERTTRIIGVLAGIPAAILAILAFRR